MDPNPATPRWNLECPFLTGRFHQTPSHKPFSMYSFSRGSDNVIGSYPVSVQELLVIDDLLSALVGIEGRYISIKRLRGREGHVIFQIDPSMDLALQELIQRIFPLCQDFVLISQFVESKSHFKSGLVNHAFAAALRALLLVLLLRHPLERNVLISGPELQVQPMQSCSNKGCSGISDWLFSSLGAFQEL